MPSAVVRKFHFDVIERPRPREMAQFVPMQLEYLAVFVLDRVELTGLAAPGVANHVSGAVLVSEQAPARSIAILDTQSCGVCERNHIADGVVSIANRGSVRKGQLRDISSVIVGVVKLCTGGVDFADDPS